MKTPRTLFFPTSCLWLVCVAICILQSSHAKAQINSVSGFNAADGLPGSPNVNELRTYGYAENRTKIIANADQYKTDALNMLDDIWQDAGDAQNYLPVQLVDGVSSKTKNYNRGDVHGAATFALIATGLDDIMPRPPNQKITYTWQHSYVISWPPPVTSGTTPTPSQPPDDLLIDTRTYAPGQLVSEKAVQTITTANAVIVSSGANVNFTAGKQIRLAPGFHAQAHSTFRASVSSGAIPPDIDPTLDSNQNGIPDYWEQANGLNPANPADAQRDFSGDGLTNLEKYLHGFTAKSYNTIGSSLGNKTPAGWSALTASAIAPASVPGAGGTRAVGFTAGQLNVDKSGAATYTIPLWAVPGTAGMTPAINLAYSSQAGNGIAGFGWSLQGASVITRGPQTLATDGQIVGMQFADTDRFYLDGQRLIAIKGANGVGGQDGQDGTEYRTQIDTFSRIVSSGRVGHGPEHFTVWTKAGLVIEYGATPDARQMANGYGIVNEVLAWHVTKITDTAGNYIEFIYDQNTAAGTHLLRRINYTGNSNTGLQPYASMRFDYTERPDPSSGYISGAKLVSNDMLSRVTSYYGETPMRDYALAYGFNPQASRPLLESITETGADGSALPPLTFEYGDPPEGFDNAGSCWELPAFLAVSGKPPQGAGFIDLNGDGRPDFVQSHIWYDMSFSSITVHKEEGAWLNTPSGWQQADNYKLPVFLACDGQYDSGVRFCDVNGDGLPDLVFSSMPDLGYCYTVYINTGSGWKESTEWQIPDTISEKLAPNGDYSGIGELNYGSGSFRMLDINGDGLPDIVGSSVTDSNSGTYPNVWLNTGHGWQYAPEYNAAFGLGESTVFLDVNGDGLPDMLHYDANGTREVALNTGHGWRILAHGTDEYNRFALPHPVPTATEMVDLNGDGLVDMAWNGVGTSQPGSGVAINTGNGWLIPPDNRLAPPYPLKKDTTLQGVAFLDINNDGMVDFVRASDSYVRETYIGNGIDWNHATYAYALPVDLTSGGEYAGCDFIDLNGDGAIDQVQSWSDKKGASHKSVWLNRRANPDRLVRVTNGLGVSASITYAPLTETDSIGAPSVYAKAALGTGPAGSVNITGPLYVVKTISNDDGTYSSSGQPNQYQLTYTYGAMRTDRLRGNLGFEWTRAYDTRTRITTLTEYSQTWPTIGSPAAVTNQITLGNGHTVTLSEASMDYDARPTATPSDPCCEPPLFVYTTESIQVSYDLDGSLTSYTRTEQNDADLDDYGNSLRLTIETGAGIRKTTINTYDNISTPDKWFLGRLTRSSVTSENTAQPGSAITRTSAFTYDPATGLLLTETIEPDHAGNPENLTLTTTYTYDVYGNKTAATLTGGGLSSPRSTSTDYDDQGRLPIKTTNALGHTETYAYADPIARAFGNPTSLTGPNNLTTEWVYDGWGRKLLELRADGSATETSYHWAAANDNAGSPSGALYFIETDVTASQPTATFYDNFGRAIYTYGINPGPADGNPRITGARTDYDNMGRAYRTTLPFYYLGNSPEIAAEATAYDPLDRPLEIRTRNNDAPDGWACIHYEYAGLTTKVTDPAGHVAMTVKDLQGQTIQTITNAAAPPGSPERGEVTHAYDPLGNLTTTTVANSSGPPVITALAYDLRGRKTGMDDPDMGQWTYDYNAAGELISQTDAKNQTSAMTYDALGRLVTRNEGGVTTTWKYDTAPRNGGAWLGKLHTITTTPDRGIAYSETYAYDTLGRPASTTRVIDNTSYTTTQTYDADGRPAVLVYPTGFQVENRYNAYGFLAEIGDTGTRGPNPASTTSAPGAGKSCFWRASGYNIAGQIEGSVFGNGLTYDRVFDPTTGLVKAISAGTGATPEIQYQHYVYDALGNVTTRRDDITGAEEHYAYDALNRLTTYTLIGPPAAGPASDGYVLPGSLTAVPINVTYDSLGNIRSRSDVGAYRYDARPHAASAITPIGGVDEPLAYDNNGNMVTGRNRILEWSAANQLRKVSENGKTAEFWFGAANERVIQKRDDGTTTIYVGSLLEIVHHPGAPTEYKQSIMTPLGRTTVRTDRSDGMVDITYYHQDALGSIFAVSDALGHIQKRFTYDPWGNRALVASATGAQLPNNLGAITRGFTDHEHLEKFGLIHMNGRVFDPGIGRFLSADPFISSPDDSQSYNRYSYLDNNPLGGTDPSGYFSLKDAIVIVVAVVVTAIVTYYSYGSETGECVSFFYALTHATAGAAMAGAAAGGFASGFSASLLNGASIGDAFNTGLIGGFTARLSD